MKRKGKEKREKEKSQPSSRTPASEERAATELALAFDGAVAVVNWPRAFASMAT